MKCKHCHKPSGDRKYCCARCKWTWHNRNRSLSPNVVGFCASCGGVVSRWESPARVRAKRRPEIYCGRVCAGAGRSGPNHPAWSGGRSIDKDGYVLLFRPDHPNANAKGQVQEHRLKMEAKLGRLLRKGEVVHHRNDNPSDNRLRNLKLYPSNAEHKADDAKKRKRDARGRLLKKG